jgi:hypothetical protein
MKRKDTGLDAGAVTLLQLFKGEREYVSPLFQRQYVWGKKEIDSLLEGVDQILEKSESERFLGALVLEVKSAGRAFKPESAWIVDGQQRLTTLYVALLEMAKLAKNNNANGLATLLFEQYIFNQGGQYKNRPKVQPTLIDFRQFNSLFSGINTPKPVLYPDFGLPTGSLTAASSILTKGIRERCFVNDVFNENVATELVSALLEKLAFVQIILGEEHDAHQVFDSLNSQGIRLENKDLIRNVVFQKLSDNPEVAQQIYQSKWIPLEESLGPKFDGYFFPFALVHKPNTTKSNLLHTLRDKWKSLEAYEIIEDLKTHIHTFNALSSTELSHCHTLTNNSSINVAIVNLNRMNVPTSIYSFIFRLIDSFRHDVISEISVTSNLRMIESFLVRRAFAGFEPTGLHAVFKNLWDETGGDPQKFLAIIDKNTTVKFPTDEEFASDVKLRPLYGRRLQQYILWEYERGLSGGDLAADSVKLTVDHVMPQTLTSEWSNEVSENEHEKLKHVWANLVPLSGSTNSEKGQKSWGTVRSFFQTETVFKSTKRLAQVNENWNADAIRKRGEELATWAVVRWPKDEFRPPSKIK